MLAHARGTEAPGLYLPGKRTHTRRCLSIAHRPQATGHTPTGNRSQVAGHSRRWSFLFEFSTFLTRFHFDFFSRWKAREGIAHRRNMEKEQPGIYQRAEGDADDTAGDVGFSTRGACRG